MKTYKLLIKGKVQGVWFRSWFEKNAKDLKLNGYIHNLNNINEVESIIQGDIKSIEKIAKLSKIGPPMAKVEKIILKELFDTNEYDIFEIK